MHLILHSSTRALVTVAICTAPDGGVHRGSMCTQTKPVHIPHTNMLREHANAQGSQGTDSKVASGLLGGLPQSSHECMTQLEGLGGQENQE